MKESSARIWLQLVFVAVIVTVVGTLAFSHLIREVEEQRLQAQQLRERVKSLDADFAALQQEYSALWGANQRLGSELQRAADENLMLRAAVQKAQMSAALAPLPEMELTVRPLPALEEPALGTVGGPIVTGFVVATILAISQLLIVVLRRRLATHRVSAPPFIDASYRVIRSGGRGDQVERKASGVRSKRP